MKLSLVLYLEQPMGFARFPGTKKRQDWSIYLVSGGIYGRMGWTRCLTINSTIQSWSCSGTGLSAILQQTTLAPIIKTKITATDVAKCTSFCTLNLSLKTKPETDYFNPTLPLTSTIYVYVSAQPKQPTVGHPLFVQTDF